MGHEVRSRKAREEYARTVPERLIKSVVGLLLFFVLCPLFYARSL